MLRAAETEYGYGSASLAHRWRFADWPARTPGPGTLGLLMNTVTVRFRTAVGARPR